MNPLNFEKPADGNFCCLIAHMWDRSPGQAVADHLAVQPIDTDEPVRPAQQAPDEDILSPMYLDPRSLG